MTAWLTQTQTCCLCETENECQLVESTDAEGSPDLDLRPAPPERDTMHAWFQECSNCHYVCVDLARESNGARSIVDSDRYRTLVADSALSDTARKFALCAVLNREDREICGTALLRAAWDCDDQQNNDLAKSFRDDAADSWKKLQPFEDNQDHATMAVTLIDVLRRAGRFDEAVKLANQMVKFKSVKRSDVMLAVIKFQQSLCESESIECRKLEDAVKG